MKKVKKTRLEHGNRADNDWTCMFCDVRPLWADRAVFNALLLQIPSLARANEKKVTMLKFTRHIRNKKYELET